MIVGNHQLHLILKVNKSSLPIKLFVNLKEINISLDYDRWTAKYASLYASVTGSADYTLTSIDLSGIFDLRLLL